MGVGRNLTKSTKITLGGNWEDPTNLVNRAMRRRYQPANVGFALVQSETADVFALRLAHNLALVSYQFRPNPDIPKDWNIIPFPINPRYRELAGLDCHTTILDVPDDVDMAIISVAAEAVLEVVRQCAQKGVKAVVIFSAGFSEVGAEGERLQQDLREIARQSNMRLLGPNSLGLINLANSVIRGLQCALG